MPVEVGPRPDVLRAPVSVGLSAAPGVGRPRFTVRLPGWDDVIHVRPTASLDPRERRERARRIRDALARSPTPEVVANLARIAQEIDAVQDALVVLSVGGRVAVKVAGRALPGVGWVAAGADLLNVVNVFYPPTLARAAVSVTGRAGARVSGRRRYTLSRESKRQLGLLSGQTTGTYRQRLAETVKTGKVGFGWGEALQALQTSDELFGIGVSLGPIFGAMQDTFFGLLRGAEFDFTAPALTVTDAVSEAQRLLLGPLARFVPDLVEPLRSVVKSGVRLEWAGYIPLVEELVGYAPGAVDRAVAPLVAPLAAPVAKVAEKLNAVTTVGKQAIVGAALRVWQAGRWLAGVRGALPWEEHIELALAQLLALQELTPFLQQTDWGVAASAAAAAVDRELARQSRHGSGFSLVGEVSAIARDGLARLPLDWLADAPSPVAREFGHALVSSFADALLDSLEGPRAPVRVESSVLWRALLTAHDYDLLPPFARTDAETLRYLDSLVLLERASALARPALADVRAVWVGSFPGALLD